MSRPASPIRRRLRDLLLSGFSGDYEALASLAGVRPESARATLKEMSRDGQACARERKRTIGRAGASRAEYTALQQPQTFDALGFALRVWR
jgi:hypothetical protein